METHSNMQIDHFLIAQTEQRTTGQNAHDVRVLMNYYTLYIGLTEPRYNMGDKFNPLIEYIERVMRKFIRTGVFQKDWQTSPDRPKISANDFVRKGDTCIQEPS